MAAMIGAVGESDFSSTVIEQIQSIIPTASWSVYQLGTSIDPVLHLSSSREVPDRTRDCWCAYLSGPYLHDNSFGLGSDTPTGVPNVCHVTAQEVAPEHRLRVYDAFGMAERVSVACSDVEGLFAVNFYRHAHQPRLRDQDIATFEDIALSILQLAKKHIAVLDLRRTIAKSAEQSTPNARSFTSQDMRAQLLRICPDLTDREADVCLRLLKGMTYEGIACDLNLSLSSVRTYRVRAYNRLGISFRSQLVAKVAMLGG